MSFTIFIFTLLVFGDLNSNGVFSASGVGLQLFKSYTSMEDSNVPWSKVATLGMVIPPFNRNPYNGYINPYYWVDDHPLLYGNNGSLDPGTNKDLQSLL